MTKQLIVNIVAFGAHFGLPLFAQMLAFSLLTSLKIKDPFLIMKNHKFAHKHLPFSCLIFILT
jgi:hypothetical protein